MFSVCAMWKWIRTRVRGFWNVLRSCFVPAAKDNQNEDPSEKITLKVVHIIFFRTKDWGDVHVRVYHYTHSIHQKGIFPGTIFPPRCPWAELVNNIPGVTQNCFALLKYQIIHTPDPDSESEWTRITIFTSQYIIKLNVYRVMIDDPQVQALHPYNHVLFFPYYFIVKLGLL